MRECIDCDWCKPLTDSNGVTFYFCMDAESPNYLEETGLMGNCELLDDDADGVKDGGLLDEILKGATGNDGLCKTCGNIVPLKYGMIGCKAHDKIIMPDYPPYGTPGQRCPEWVACKGRKG